MIINQIEQVRAENLDWESIGDRVREIRYLKGLSEEEAAQQLNLKFHQVRNLENSIPDRKSTNIIWSVVNNWGVSLNWLLNGLGSPDDSDPNSLLPETIIIEKGAGIRRNPQRQDAEEGTYGEDVLEFVLAIDKFKKHNNVTFLSNSQIFELLLALGYRKTAKATIAPIKHFGIQCLTD